MVNVYANRVDGVSNPPTLVMLAPSDDSGWCQQFSEEGYRVIHIIYSQEISESINDTIAEVQQHLSVDANTSRWAMLTYGLKNGDDLVSSLVSWADDRLKACIHFTPETEDPLQLLYNDKHLNFIPTIVHLSSKQESLHAALIGYTDASRMPTRPAHEIHPINVYTYPQVPVAPPFPLLTAPPAMAAVVPGGNPNRNLYIESATSLSYSRTLGLLRHQLGPYFDFEALWDRHTYYEFSERDYKKTMSTMVATPYVNHIPTMTGGVGHDDLARFYKHHFTNVTPPDCETITISRTVGPSRIIDELLFKCTHTTEIDYFLPGVKPTGKPLEIAIVAVVSMRGDKLAFDYWDQASVLVQVGLLNPENLPVAGYEVTRKMTDPLGLPSNTLLQRWKDSEGLE